MKSIQMDFMHTEQRYINLKDASKWASNYTKQSVSVSNISYLIQYGRIKRYLENGNTLIDQIELKEYYDSQKIRQQNIYSNADPDLNWNLSFTEYKESERTKHVHRLHPYKGKFIPQLVEYFLDSHTDEFKKEVFFEADDIILDPFCGSGTTLIQANELGINAIGVDVSAFNTMISNVKIADYNLFELKKILDELTRKLIDFNYNSIARKFEDELISELANFNNKFFPSPEYKRKLRNKQINEKEYGKEKEELFLKIFWKLAHKYKIEIIQDNSDSFLDVWYLPSARKEIDFLYQHIQLIKDLTLKKVVAVILSRTIRSCRATTHADLGTLKKPVRTTYYCRKHGKICKPLFSILNWWKRYSSDTVKRLDQFSNIKTNTYQRCFTADSRNIDFAAEIKAKSPEFLNTFSIRKINGIFSSPPYVGLINYHEQHAYAYDLFGFNREDNKEIGPLFKGKGKQARESYAQGISDVLLNSKKFLTDDYNVFLVANDQFNLYPKIAQLADMKIVNQFKRPVLNRVEKNRSAYSETIFHLKEL